MGEYLRLAPSHWSVGRANRPVFVAVRVLHQDHAHLVRPEPTGKIAAGQPFALEVATDLRPVRVDGAAARETAIPAQRTGGFLKLRNLEG